MSLLRNEQFRFTCVDKLNPFCLTVRVFFYLKVKTSMSGLNLTMRRIDFKKDVQFQAGGQYLFSLLVNPLRSARVELSSDIEGKSL